MEENSYSDAVLNIGDSEEKIVEVPGVVTTSSSDSISEETVVESQENVPTGETDEDGNEITYDYTLFFNWNYENK